MDVSKPINPSDIFSAKGLVVVITGGGSGIGLAFASALARTSAHKVYLLGRRQQTLQDAAKITDPSGDVVVPVQCDVTSPASLSEVAKQIEQDVGYLDVVVNNAGITGPRHNSAYNCQSIEEVQKLFLSDWEGWADTFAVNTSAVVGVSAAFLHLLNAGNTRRGWEAGKIVDRARTRQREEAQKTGVEVDDERSSQIITVASIAGFNRHITAGLAYSSSKAGAVHLGKMLSTFLAPYGIRSNVICPGIYPSEMTVGAKDEYTTNEIPAGRKGNLDDLAGVILYLVGKGGAYVNGNVQITDGGRLSMHQGTY